MIAILVRRLATALPTLLAVVLLSFLLMRVAPGSPFDSERPLDAATRTAMDKAYGLDQPFLVQLGRYLARVVQGDFGPSLVYKDFTITQLIAQGLPVSLMLGGLALLLAAVLGIAGGILGALRPGSWLDRWIGLKSAVAVALPTFVTGPLLVLVFALWLPWLPVSGLGGPASLVLPVLALSLPVAGAVARLTRTGLAATMVQDHVRTARARGIKPLPLLLRHALPPALIPVVSYLGPAAAGLLTGAVVIETVFGLPGLGRYFVQGALNRDYPLVLGVVILYAGLILAFNLIADLLYGWLDPRARG